MQNIEKVVQRASSSLNIAIPISVLTALFVGFSYREGWEPVRKLFAIGAFALGLSGCAGTHVSDVSLRHGETFRDRVAVVAAHEDVRLSVSRAVLSEFDFSLVSYPQSHFAVVVTDSYTDGVIALRVRVYFAGGEIQNLTISETIGEVDGATSRDLLAMFANDPATLRTIVAVVRDALVVADAKNKKYQQRIVENW